MKQAISQASICIMVIIRLSVYYVQLLSPSILVASKNVQMNHMCITCNSQHSEKMASHSSACSSEYKLIAEPDDDLKCLICLGVARDPLQHEACGKLYCEACLEEYGRDKPCPNCRMQESHYYVDKRSKSKKCC